MESLTLVIVVGAVTVASIAFGILLGWLLLVQLTSLLLKAGASGRN